MILNEKIKENAFLNLLLKTFIVLFLSILSYFITTLFHLLKLPVFNILPLHWIIFFITLIFGWKIGIFISFFSVIFSFIFSGKPIIPILYFIIIELISYSFFSDFLHNFLFIKNKIKPNIFFSILIILISSISGKFFYTLLFLTFYKKDPLLNIIKYSFLPGVLSSIILILVFSYLFFLKYYKNKIL